MNQYLGQNMFQNFSKPTSFEYSSGSVVVAPNPNPNPTVGIDESKVQELVLQKIASLNKNQDEVDLLNDKNPLDNIIVNEVITLLGYRKLSHSDIQRALELHAQGQDASHDMTYEQHVILLTQAKELEYITEQQYLSISGTPNMFWFNFPEAYLKVLDFQLKLPSTIPTIEELKIAGIVELILTTVKENPDAYIDENVIQYYTEKYINNLLLSSEFIGYEKAQKIYADPLYLMNILDKETLRYFLYRLKPYLNFITDAKISQIMGWLPSQYNQLNTVFTPTQIRLMIDKELDIKNLILKTLTLEEVTRTFNELAAQFKVDFTNTFTNEKLMELIQLTIEKMYPILTNEEIYQNLATLFETEITPEKINNIEAYLASY